MSEARFSSVLVIGANSAIAGALVSKLLEKNPNTKVVAISRSAEPSGTSSHESQIRWVQSDYSEQSMSSICAILGSSEEKFDRVFICNGILHEGEIGPEKRLQEVNVASLHKIFHVNAFIPILWLKHLIPIIEKDLPSVVTVLSARVGSIDDNQQGGWYGYRSSKAAMNMLLKTAAIEYRRLSDNIKFLAFHPGTTDTPLSKPFQKTVPSGKLFKPEFVAEQLITLIESLPEVPALNFLDWEGKTVTW